MQAMTVEALFRRLNRDDTAETIRVITEWLEANLPLTHPDNEITIKIGT